MARNEIYGNVGCNKVFDVSLVSSPLVKVNIGKVGTLGCTIEQTLDLHNQLAGRSRRGYECFNLQSWVQAAKCASWLHQSSHESVARRAEAFQGRLMERSSRRMPA